MKRTEPRNAKPLGTMKHAGWLVSRRSAPGERRDVAQCLEGQTNLSELLASVLIETTPAKQ
jgi:hypothetical protein